MGYQFRRKKDVEANLRAVACEELDKAIEECRSDTLSQEEAVHQVRKRCKKLRGLIRIVGPVFPGFKKEDAAFRKAARRLSAARDADVVLAAFDDLSQRYEPLLKVAATQPLRRALESHAERNMVEDDVEDVLAAAAVDLEAARRRAARYVVKGDGFSPIAAGFGQTLRAARQARRLAQAEPTVEHLHDWRKHVKYHNYHLNLLTPVWPDMVGVYAGAANDLQELLGDDHDLAVLRQQLLALGGHVDPAPVRIMTSLIDWRREAFLRKIHRLGDRLFAEKPGRFIARIERHWDVWRAPNAGEEAVTPHAAASGDQLVSGD